MKGLNADEVASLRRNMPNTSTTNPTKAQRIINYAMFKRGLLYEVKKPDKPGWFYYEITPLGRLAILCYIAENGCNI